MRLCDGAEGGGVLLLVLCVWQCCKSLTRYKFILNSRRPSARCRQNKGKARGKELAQPRGSSEITHA
jgi:hypothetical protein